MFKRWGQLLLPIFLLTACGHPATTPAIPTAEISPVPATATPADAATASVAQSIPSPSPTRVPPAVPGMPIPTPAGLPTDLYTVQPGDTLSAIAYYRCGCEMEELMALNNIEDPSGLQAGQSLRIPVQIDRVGPATQLLPDSEVVYSPSYIGFDVAGFIREKGGYLATYTQQVSGQERTGAQLVEMISQDFSVGPRVLLALLEYQSRWVTSAPATELEQEYPMSLGHGGQAGLYFQLSWAANRVNEGYYGYKRHGMVAFTFADRSRALTADGLNAGTVGIQNVLAMTTDWETWRQAVDADGFIRTYQALFGDPYARAIEPLVPADLTQPTLSLPWEGGHTWYLSGGPHGAWFGGSAWAALDFAPPDVRGHCGISNEWGTAAAPGSVLRAGDGKVLIDLDWDGYEQTGWVLFYLHLAADDDLQPDTVLAQGDPVGHPSCFGGEGNSSHLHIARRYNGEWMAADGPVPMVLSGWRPVNGLAPYEGELVKGDEVRQACECWEEGVNGIVSDNTVLR